MGQQGSHQFSEPKSNRGSSELLSTDGKNGHPKNKLFKSFGSKNKSKSRGGKNKKCGTEEDLSITPKSSYNKKISKLDVSGKDSTDNVSIQKLKDEKPLIKKVDQKDIDKGNKQLIKNSESYWKNEEKLKKKNDSNESLQRFYEASCEEKSHLQPTTLNFDKTSFLSVSSMNNPNDESDKKNDFGRDIYLDAQSSYSPGEEYLSAAENGSVLSVNSDRPSTALSSRTITPVDDALRDNYNNISSETLPQSPLAKEETYKNKHKQVETKPYILTSRLLSTSGKYKNTIPIDSKNATLTKVSDKNASSQNFNTPASKFGFSLESGMEATADVFDDGTYSSELAFNQSDKDSGAGYSDKKHKEKTKGFTLRKLA